MIARRLRRLRGDPITIENFVIDMIIIIIIVVVVVVIIKIVVSNSYLCSRVFTVFDCFFNCRSFTGLFQDMKVLYLR